MHQHPAVSNIFRVNSTSSVFHHPVELNKNNINGDVLYKNDNKKIINNNRTNQNVASSKILFEKNSYLLWIVTPVATRYLLFHFIYAIVYKLF